MGKALLRISHLKSGLLIAAILFVAFAVCGSALLAFFVVPAPDAHTAVEVSGLLKHINPPHPEYGDLTINLMDGRSFYVNRADEVDYFQWQRLLQEAGPGDRITLTVVRPLAWRLLGKNQVPSYGPVAGVRTDAAVYMDPVIPATTWTAQASAVRHTISLIALLVILVIVFRYMPRS